MPSKHREEQGQEDRGSEATQDAPNEQSRGVGRATYQETTALGAALFAGLGAGLYATPEEAVAARPSVESFRTLASDHYREQAYARWLDAVARVRSGA